MNVSAEAFRAALTLATQPSEAFVKLLPEIGLRIGTLIEEFVRDPCPIRAERLCIELEGLRRHIFLAREALLREARDPNA